MIEYTLNTRFTNEQLEALHATGSKVVVAKPPEGGSPNVAWQVFAPLQANKLEWEEQYGIYTSRVEMEHGAKLTQASWTEIPSGDHTLYTMEPSAVISGPAVGGSANAFSLLNSYTEKDYLTAGLYQDATVDGTKIVNNAISAAPVLLGSTATMTPYTTVYIWVQSEIESNTVVTMVTSPMTELKFGGGKDTISVFFDTATGRFTPSDK